MMPFLKTKVRVKTKLIKPKSLHYFPVADMTTYHKFPGLKRHTFIITYFCRLESDTDRSHWARIKV
jgi:hypothetical protein